MKVRILLLAPFTGEWMKNKSPEQAFLEKVEVYTTHWVFKYRIIIYDKITKNKITEYGLFDEISQVEAFAQEHNIKLVRK